MGIPKIFHVMQPVKPGETVMISGEDIGSNATLQLSYKDKTYEIKPVRAAQQTLMAVIPEELPFDAYTARILSEGGASREFVINKPEIWWTQGEAGVSASYPGAFLRIFGICLDLGGAVTVRLGSHVLQAESSDLWHIRVTIPEETGSGEYELTVANSGAVSDPVKVTVAEKPVAYDRVITLKADNTGRTDCTREMEAAISDIAQTGGTLFIPRGRYRLDFDGSRELVIPENVTLCGAGEGLTSLWWTNRDLPVQECLIKGDSNFGIRDLAIYAQGPLRDIIHGVNNVRIERVRLRANTYYMTCSPQKVQDNKRGRVIYEGYERGGYGLWLDGCNNRVIDCDLLCDFPLHMHYCHGNIISGNQMSSEQQCYGIYGSNNVFENNTYNGGLHGTGGNVALHFTEGYATREHVYYRGNKFKNMYSGDHEMLTFDGHGAMYNGRVTGVSGNIMYLEGDRLPKGRNSGCKFDESVTGIWAYIVDGRGCGQYQPVKHYDTKARTVELDHAWECEPDEHSIINIGCFNGNHLILDNEGEDVGALVQLYAPNCNCIVAGNRGRRAETVSSLANSGIWHRTGLNDGIDRIEISWYNIFSGNEIIEGNAWGGGTTEHDRWLGGESYMNIQADCNRYIPDENGVTLAHRMKPGEYRILLNEEKERSRVLSPSRWQIIRGHVIHNNSKIRVRGPVTDVVIENCSIAHTDTGIDISAHIDYVMPCPHEPKFNWSPDPTDEHPAMAFQSPEGIVIRNNRFEDVTEPYAGNWIHACEITEK